MTVTAQASPPMSLYAHWLVETSIRHQAAVRAAKALDHKLQTGRTAAEAEVSRLTVSLIDQLHVIGQLVDDMGAHAVFTTPRMPYTDEQLAVVRAPAR